MTFEEQLAKDVEESHKAQVDAMKSTAKLYFWVFIIYILLIVIF